MKLMEDVIDKCANINPKVTIKKYVLKPPVFTAIEYLSVNFDELLKDGRVDGRDRQGVFIEIQGQKRYIEDGDFILLNHFEENDFNGRKVIPKQRFNLVYQLLEEDNV